MIWIALAALLLAALVCFLVWPGRALPAQKAAFAGVNCAHRGLHT